MKTILQMQKVCLTYHTQKNETTAIKNLDIIGYEG